MLCRFVVQFVYNPRLEDGPDGCHFDIVCDVRKLIWLTVFTCQCQIYTTLPVFTCHCQVYIPLPVFPCYCQVYIPLPVFTCLATFTPHYQCLPAIARFTYHWQCYMPLIGLHSTGNFGMPLPGLHTTARIFLGSDSVFRLSSHIWQIFPSFLKRWTQENSRNILDLSSVNNPNFRIVFPHM